jgi:hypothetical protein
MVCGSAKSSATVRGLLINCLAAKNRLASGANDISSIFNWGCEMTPDTELEDCILDLLPDDAGTALKVLAVCYAWVVVGAGAIDADAIEYVQDAIIQLRIKAHELEVTAP